MKLFAVLGMHRSGTSTVARILNLLGGNLGPLDDLMPPKPDNPTGFWESLTVTQLHDDLLDALGARWFRPPLLDAGWESRPELAPFVERAREIVTRHFSSTAVAVWKDPRGSFLLPLWRKVAPVAGTVRCVRNPDDVAHSLRRREGMDPERTAALWLRYTVSAFQDEAPHIVVRFDEAYEQPVELTRRLAEFLGLPAATNGILQEVTRFVDPSLRHFTVPPADAGPLMQLARAAHTILIHQPPEVTRPIFAALSNGWRLESHFLEEAAERVGLQAKLLPSAIAILKEWNAGE